MPGHPTTCSKAPQRESIHFLPCLVRVITLITLIHCICQNTPCRRVAICNCLSWARTQTVPIAKKVAFLTTPTGRHVYRWNFPHGLTRRTIKFQKEKLLTGLPPWSPVTQKSSVVTLTSSKKPGHITLPPTSRTGPMAMMTTSPTSLRS